MMRYVLKSDSLKIYVDNPRSQRPQVKDVSDLLVLHPDQIDLILGTVIRRAVGREFRTRIGYVDSILRSLGRYLKWSGHTTLPEAIDEWQFFLSQWALWHISNQESSMSLEARCGMWKNYIRPWINSLIDEDVIPFGVSVPELKLPKQVMAIATQSLISERAPVSTYKQPQKKSMDNTIAGPILWRDDVTYLDEFLMRLREKDKILEGVLDDYWLKLIIDFRKGKQLMGQITDHEFTRRSESGDWKEKIFPGFTPKTQVASPKHPKGAAWMLRIIKNLLETGGDLGCVGPFPLRAHPAFQASFARSKMTIEPLVNLTGLDAHQIDNTPSYLILSRFIGLLNTLDMAVAMALLIREHPNLNPESLAGAKLICSKGKHFLIPQGEGSRPIFSVDKPRARSRKYCQLTKRATRIVRHILRATHPVRELMKRLGTPQRRYLFLGITSETGSRMLGHPAGINAGVFHRSSGCTLSKYYPILADHGLEAGTISFSRIRSTQGVLAWFDEGGIASCAAKLGNTEEVSMKNYIPEALLAAWNERIVRRFQNTLLVLAAANETYLLNVADFKTISELQHFIAQLIFDSHPDDSPLSKKIHELFGERYKFCVSKKINGDDQNGLIYVKLSCESLAILIGYKNWALGNLSPEQSSFIDESSKRSPSDFIKLAQMIQELVIMPNPNDILREAYDIARLKRIYKDAELLVPVITEKFNAMSISVE